MKPSYDIYELPSNPPGCAEYGTDYEMSWGNFDDNGNGYDLSCNAKLDNQGYGVWLEHTCNLDFSQSGTGSYLALPKSAFLSFDVTVGWRKVISYWNKDKDGE